MFRVGQKVVYIGGPRLHGEWSPPNCGPGLTKGTVYTIREIDEIYCSFYAMPGIRVHELVCRPIMWRGRLFEPGTLVCKFRPLVERKTDIDVFKKMLTPKRKERVE